MQKHISRWNKWKLMTSSNPNISENRAQNRAKSNRNAMLKATCPNGTQLIYRLESSRFECGDGKKRNGWQSFYVHARHFRISRLKMSFWKACDFLSIALACQLHRLKAWAKTCDYEHDSMMPQPHLAQFGVFIKDDLWSASQKCLRLPLHV